MAMSGLVVILILMLIHARAWVFHGSPRIATKAEDGFTRMKYRRAEEDEAAATD